MIRPMMQPVMRLAVLALAALSWLAPTGTGHAQTARPLVIDGTSTVFQRVLTRPGAALHETAGGPELRRYPPFQPLYVFARAEGWVQVGPSPRAAAEGWVEEARVVDWKQNIVAAFTNPASRQRSLMFGTAEGLRGFMENESLVDLQARLIDKADRGLLVPEDDVVTIEPENFVNIRDNLYLMPILDFSEEIHPLNYEPNLLLQAASIPLEDGLPQAGGTAPGGDFDAGVVFVLDTTMSMGPFIDRTQKALSRIVNDIEGTEVGARINFGAIAFREDPEAVPGLEYRTKMLIPLERRFVQAPVIRAISEATKVATVSTIGFNEDSLAGVEDAIDEIDWDQGGNDPFDGRYIILVTDAGPNDPRDPYSRSEIGPVELQRDAEGRNIVIMTLHLKTASGAGTHDYAAEQYRKLSRFGQRRFYYPIEGGSEEEFEATVTTLITALTDHVRAARGEATVLDDAATGEDLRALGREMRLAWLGAREGTRAPDMIRGWVSERAAEKPSALAVEPRLLISKNELATMAELLEKLVALAESTRDETGARSFFDQVQGVLAAMAQNPDTVVDAGAETLGGALEYLERLPYRSQLLQMDQQTWAQSALRRRPIIDGMRQKLALYRKWLYDGSVWTALYDGAPDGDLVFAMPFDTLP